MCAWGALSPVRLTSLNGVGQGRPPQGPRPSVPPPPPLTLTLLWNVCSCVCTLTQGEEVVNAAGTWPSSTKRGGPQFSWQS